MHSKRSTSLVGLLVAMGACGGRQITGEASGDHNAGGSVGAGGTPTQGSGGAVGQGGSGPAMPVDPRRCSFGTAPPNLSPPAPPDVVQARIVRFILGDQQKPSFLLPATDSPGWASETAIQLLDSFGSLSSSSPGGFVRWLAKWSYDGKAPQSAARWANELAGRGAALSTLISPPNPDGAPGLGYMTDQEILAGRSTIDRRGMMVQSHLFCSLVPPAPPGFMTMPPVLMPGVTERQYHEQSISNPACAACHRMLDPLGHAFQHFDRTGVWRELENGVRIDSSDAYTTPMGETFEFVEIADLAQQLSESCEVARCISRSFLSEAIDPTLPANADPPFSDDELLPIANAFADSKFSIRALVSAIVESPAFQRP